MATTDMEAANTSEDIEYTDCPTPLQIEGSDKQVQETCEHITGSTREASYPPENSDYQMVISIAEPQENIGHKKVTVMEEPVLKL